MTATATNPAGEPARRPSLWRSREFMKLWTGETISQFGTQVSALAIPLIAALLLHVTPFEFGLLATVEFLPFILISLPAGVWVDRLRRKPIMIIGDLGRAAALLSIPIAAYFQVLTIWQLYLVGFINGCLTVFFDVSYQAYLPSLVEREDILEGNSKLEISRSAAQITGPGIAGFLIGLISAPVAILIDSVSFVGSAFFLWRIKKPEPTPQRKTDAEGKHIGMRTEIGEGLRWVLGSPYLRAIAACTATSNLFGNMGFAIVLLYAVSAVASGGLGLEPQQIGIILSVGSIGALVAAVSANRIGKWLGVGPTIVISIFLGAPPALVIALMPPDLAVPLGAAALFLLTFSGVVYNINQVSFRQAITPTPMQGRMNATMRFIVWGTIPIANLIGGFLGGTIGLQQTLIVSGVLSFIPVLPVLFSPVRSIGEMPAPMTDEQASQIVGEALDETARPAPLPNARIDDDLEAPA